MPLLFQTLEGHSVHGNRWLAVLLLPLLLQPLLLRQVVQGHELVFSYFLNPSLSESFLERLLGHVLADELEDILDELACHLIFQV